MSNTVLRFVTQAKHPPYGYRSGVFQIASALRDVRLPGKVAWEGIDTQLTWFEENKKTPSRFSVSRHPRATETAIAWVKAKAIEHVRQLRLLVAFVEESGNVPLEELRTKRPGYVVFEDDYQIVALPFADTPR